MVSLHDRRSVTVRLRPLGPRKVKEGAGMSDLFDRADDTNHKITEVMALEEAKKGLRGRL
jgi:hypothetical protein